MYKSIIIITKLILNEEGTALKLDVPFTLYAQNIVMEGKDITYRLHDLSNEGKEVLAKVDYMSEDLKDTLLKDESQVAEYFTGNLGCDWNEVQKDARYLKHYNVKKEDALATYTTEGVKVLYDGLDKDEVTKFCEYEEHAGL